MRTESWQAALGQETTTGPPSAVGPALASPPLACELPLLAPVLPLTSEPLPPLLETPGAPVLVPAPDPPDEAPDAVATAPVDDTAPEPSPEPLAPPLSGVLLEQLRTTKRPAARVMLLNLIDTCFRCSSQTRPSCDIPAVADGIGIGSR
jgi:hypothetical protein